MEGKIFIFLLLAILLTSQISAIEISMKDNVKKGENFIIHISGNFVDPLTRSDIQFYRNYPQYKTSMDPYELEYIEGDYYISLSIPLEKLTGNYSLVLDGIRYKIGNQIMTDPVVKDFVISEDQVPFSVIPALLIVDSETYDIYIQNLLSSSIEIDMDSDIKTIEDINDTGETVESKSFFDILLGLFEEGNVSDPVFDIPETSDKIYIKSGEIKTLTYESPEKAGFETLNFFYEGNAYASLIYSGQDRSFYSTQTIEEENDTTNVTDANYTNDNETSYNITYDDNGTIIVGNITFTDEENETISEINTSSEEYQTVIRTCEVIGGQICYQGNETCEGELKNTKYAKCCIGECLPIKKSGTGKTVGWILIITIAIFVTWFIKKKYMRAGPSAPNLLNIGKK